MNVIFSHIFVLTFVLIDDFTGMDSALECFQKQHPIEASPVARYVLGVTMFLITMISILLNIIIAMVIFRTSLTDKPIRPHITGLVIASLIFLSSNCFTLLPTVLGDVHIIDPYNIIFTTPNTLGYLLIMFTTTTMAIDRFLIFFTSSIGLLSSVVFRWVIFMGMPYTFALILTVHMNIIGCYKRVNLYTLGFTYGCR
ncbi:hypothetical protein GCK32_008972 [Trichostrongylus colubriformis]|uniref:Uncharacterized protein n=1 Tax=Trichostrongylus colubriformis TaxID=6319 RepID=A0AAN8J3R0_TRICO